MNALAAVPNGTTLTITPEAIRARIQAARRVLELAQSLQTAETMRNVVAVALADAAAGGQTLATIVPEYERAVAALVYAKAAYTQAEDELNDARATIRLSA